MLDMQHHIYYNQVCSSHERPEACRVRELCHLCQRLASNDPRLSKVDSGDGDYLALRSDDEALLLALSLVGNTNVEMISLGLHGVSAQGAASLQNALSSAKSLYCLCLEGSFLERETTISAEEVWIIHGFIDAVMQNSNEVNLFLSNCPVATSSLMAAVGRLSNIGHIGVTNCILVEDQKDVDIQFESFDFSETLHAITYGEGITPGRETERRGMLQMGNLMSQICHWLPQPMELHVDLAEASHCGFDWFLLLSNAKNIMSIDYQMGEEENNHDAFFSLLSKTRELEELQLEMPSWFACCEDKIQELVLAITRNDNLRAVELHIRRPNGDPIACHIPQVEAHCTKILRAYTGNGCHSRG